MSAGATITALVAQHEWEVLALTATEGAAMRVPIRLETGDDALLYVYEDELTAARATEAHRWAGQQLFAVPELVTSGPGWLVVEHPPGRPLREVVAKFDGDRAAVVAERLGEVLRKLHQLPCEPFCGDVAPEADGGERWLTFSGYVAHHLEWFSESMRQHAFEERDAEALTSAIGDLRHELSAFHPRNPVCLCHGRLTLDNVWLDEVRHDVVGITGFERAAQIPREADVAYLLWIAELGDERVIRAFYAGYGAARTMDVQRRERFFRRLVAMQTLFGAKGEVIRGTERLVTLTSPLALG